MLDVLYSRLHIVRMLGCLTVKKPYCLLLELCEYDLLQYLYAKAKLVQQQYAVETNYVEF